MVLRTFLIGRPTLQTFLVGQPNLRTFLVGQCGTSRFQPSKIHQVRWFGQQVIKKRSFNDKVRIAVKAGKGGNGCASFMSLERYPDGESGGKGGDIYLMAVEGQQNFCLPTFHYKGQNGVSGGSSFMKGANGTHTIIKVPQGTTVYEVVGIDEITNKVTTEKIGDLFEAGQKMLVAKGGGRGKGNSSFRTSEFSSPEMSTNGGDGEAKSLVLELKSIADIGLIGYPNAGKSSLLRAISNATPKVASYPFTTLKPTVGVVTASDVTMDTMRVADIPGLIDGASENIGLGHDFLRHVERVKVLLYVIDIAGLEGRDPVQDYFSLYQELQLYDPALVQRKSMIFCNKVDRKKKRCVVNLERLRKAIPNSIPIVQGSALKKKNLDELIQNIYYLVQIQDSQSKKQALKLTKKDKEDAFFGSI